MNQLFIPELLTRKETASYLRVCLATLDNLNIPRTKIRHRVFYKRDKLDQWLEQNTEIKGVEK